MLTEHKLILQNELRDAHADLLRLDAMKRAINRLSYAHDQAIRWDDAWRLWAEYERSKK